MVFGGTSRCYEVLPEGSEVVELRYVRQEVGEKRLEGFLRLKAKYANESTLVFLL